MSKTLPKALTSYDLLKTLAVILMVLDHVGHHFYPDEMWFRVVGRLCIPIWFFLVGYARTTEIPTTFWLGGLLITASAMLSGQYILPLNILFTIILMRKLRPGFAVASVHSPESLRGMFCIILLATIPTALIFEYGSIAILFVLYGFMMRNYDLVLERIGAKYIKLFVAVSFSSFFVLQAVPFPSLSNIQAVVLGGGFAAVAFLLWRFKAIEYINANKYMAPSVIGALKIVGRHTLFIYVGHILVFRAVCMVLYPDQYGFMAWEVLPPQMLAVFL